MWEIEKLGLLISCKPHNFNLHSPLPRESLLPKFRNPVISAFGKVGFPEKIRGSRRDIPDFP